MKKTAIVLYETGLALIDYLEGKKTFIGGAIIFLAGGLKALGTIDEKAFDTLFAIGTGIAIYGLRFAVQKKKK